MKQLICIHAVLIGLFLSSPSLALEKKTISQISTTELVSATQVQIDTGSSGGVSMAWWIPHEFWAVSFEKQNTANKPQQKKLLKQLKGYNIIGIVKGKSTGLGSFNFSSKEDIGSSLTVVSTDENGNELQLHPSQTIDKDVELLVQIITPILQNVMGELGKNFHFYIFDGETSDGFRILNPYEKGKVSISFTVPDSSKLTAVMETPLDPLFVPRQCPNGKFAHISWDFCPWSGEKL